MVRREVAYLLGGALGLDENDSVAMLLPERFRVSFHWKWGRKTLVTWRYWWLLVPVVVLTCVVSFRDPVHEPRLKLAELSEECRWMLENGSRPTLRDETLVVFHSCFDPPLGCHLMRDPLELGSYVYEQVKFAGFLYDQHMCQCWWQE